MLLNESIDGGLLADLSRCKKSTGGRNRRIDNWHLVLTIVLFERVAPRSFGGGGDAGMPQAKIPKSAGKKFFCARRAPTLHRLHTHFGATTSWNYVYKIFRSGYQRTLQPLLQTHFFLPSPPLLHVIQLKSNRNLGLGREGGQCSCLPLLKTLREEKIK